MKQALSGFALAACARCQSVVAEEIKGDAYDRCVFRRQEPDSTTAPTKAGRARTKPRRAENEMNAGRQTWWTAIAITRGNAEFSHRHVASTEGQIAEIPAVRRRLKS